MLDLHQRIEWDQGIGKSLLCKLQLENRLCCYWGTINTLKAIPYWQKSMSQNSTHMETSEKLRFLGGNEFGPRSATKRLKLKR